MTEDVFVPPSTLGRAVYPRRDRPHPPRPLVADAVDQARRILSRARPSLDFSSLGQETARAAQSYLDGEPTPFGAAAAVAWLPRGNDDDYAVFADAWIAQRGIEFAVSATVELGDRGYWQPSHYKIAGRVRAALATSDADTYAAVAARLTQPSSGAKQVVAAFLLPTETALVDAACAAGFQAPCGDRWSLLYAAVSTLDQVRLLGIPDHWTVRQPAILTTLVETLGPDLTPVFAAWIDSEWPPTDLVRRVSGFLAEFPTDAAFGVLLDRAGNRHVRPALLEAMRRYPSRALCLLADRDTHAGLLRTHLLGTPDLAGHIAALPAAARARAEAASVHPTQLPDAPADALPALFTTPPWTRKPAKRPAIKGVPVPEPTLAWRPGEQATWSKRRDAHRYFADVGDWAAKVQDFRGGRIPNVYLPDLFLEGPIEVLTPLLAGWDGKTYSHINQWGRPLLAKYGVDGVRFLAGFAARQPLPDHVRVLVPALSVETAVLMGKLSVRRTTRAEALAWFDRHGAVAAPYLIPTALASGADRKHAEAGLRLIADTEAVLSAAKEHGDKVVAAVRAILDTDPLDLVPAKPPMIGDWADPAVLPRITLTDQAHALSGDATKTVLTVLSLCVPGEPYAGADLVRQVCDPESLAAFVSALFHRWEEVGAPAKDSWAMNALGVFGNDATADNITRHILAWPNTGLHQRAAAGLDVLVELGTDRALNHLKAISKGKGMAGLRRRAKDKIAEAACRRGLTSEQLADRLVPDLGLDRDGTLTLDYGPRRFVVGFDEHLKPVVSDAEGLRRKDLPKPGAKDDPDLASEAHQRFTRMKKEARAVASTQVARLELAMVRQRRWSRAEFRELIVEHPLMWHIGRRLVWGAYADGVVTGSFRPAEDRTFADVHDRPYDLPADALVGVAHQLDLGPDASVWAEVFADYEILQPFTQLGRPTFAADQSTPARFENAATTTGDLLGLVRRGWERAGAGDGGYETNLSKPLPGGREFTVDIEPGIYLGDVQPTEKQHLIGLRLTGVDSFTDLDPITASELIADLTELTAR